MSKKNIKESADKSKEDLKIIFSGWLNSSFPATKEPPAQTSFKHFWQDATSFEKAVSYIESLGIRLNSPGVGVNYKNVQKRIIQIRTADYAKVLKSLGFE